MRLAALIHKEFLQLIRDNSSILIGAVLPIILKDNLPTVTSTMNEIFISIVERARGDSK